MIVIVIIIIIIIIIIISDQNALKRVASHINELASFTSFLTSFLTLSTSLGMHCNKCKLAVLIIQTHVSFINVSVNKRSFTKPKQT